MLGFIPRLRRKLDERNWVPIGEDSRAYTPVFDDPITSARVEGPPNFVLPLEQTPTPPPSYAHLRSTARPEIASLLVGNRASYGSPRSPTNATPRQSIPPVVSSSLTSLEDIRHGQVINHVPMENRLSSVPNYPVFLEHPPSRRRRSRRPASIASTTSTGLFISMGQLPGSEPFDIQTSQVALVRNNWERWQVLVSPLLSPGSAISEPEPAGAHRETLQRVQSVQTGPRGPPRGTNGTSWLFDASNPDLQSEPMRCIPPAEGYYAPPPHNPTIRQSHTWPAQRQSANIPYEGDDVRVRFADVDSDIPPRPPPKDPGYVCRPPSGVRRGDHGLRKTHSSPNLLRFTGFHRKSQERLSSKNHHRRTVWDMNNGRMAESSRLFAGGKFSNRSSHFLNALGKFISRSVPRVVATA
jgi:hypothetical protein